MSLHDDMRQHAAAHPGESSYQLARSFLAEHEKAELEPLVANEFSHILRRYVRAAESVVSMLGRARAGRPLRLADSQRMLHELAPILDARYAVGDGRPRAGRDMTVADWEARRAMLLGQIVGIQRAVTVCDRAVEIIRAHGVSTLGEIKGVTKAA